MVSLLVKDHRNILLGDSKQRVTVGNFRYQLVAKLLLRPLVFVPQLPASTKAGANYSNFW